MSADANESTTDRPSREVAYRLFAAEFDDASYSYSESEEERAPNYVVTPTGARVNRLFTVGVLTEVEAVNDDVLRGRVVDPTGAFVSYAGQYQPEEMAFLDQASPPAFVALSGKARTFTPDDSDRVFTSVRPESISRVDADTRDRWTVSAAEATLHRVGVMAAALQSGLTGERLRTALYEAGVDESLATGVPRAIEHYGTTPAYLAGLHRVARDALEVVADARDSVRPLDVGPSDAGTGEESLAAMAADLDLPSAADIEAETASAGAEGADAVGETAPAGDDTEATEAETTPTTEAGATDAGTPETTADVLGGEATETETETETESEEPAAASGETVSEQTATETPSASTESTPEPAERVADSSESAVESTASTGEPTDEPDDPTETAASSGGVDELGDFDTGGASADETEGDELGDFDAGAPSPSADTDADESSGADDVSDTADDGMYELDESEREEIEAEFGTEFSTGSEVAPAGEADIDVPSVEELEEELDEDLGSETAESTEADAGTAADAAEESGETAADAADAADTADTVDEPAEDVDLEAAAVEAMAALDDGDGATREAVVASVVDDHGVDPEAVEDAIQSALMSGQCYEPNEDSLKAI